MKGDLHKVRKGIRNSKKIKRVNETNSPLAPQLEQVIKPSLCFDFNETSLLAHRLQMSEGKDLAL